MPLKAMIKKKGINISQLARGVKISYTHAWRLVHHQRRPSPELSQTIVEFFNHEITVMDLLFEDYRNLSHTKTSILKSILNWLKNPFKLKK